MPKLINMSQSELIVWVRSLNFKFGQAIIDGINKESEESGIAVTGRSFWKADDADDLSDILGINSNRAEALYQKIQQKKETDFEADEKEISFKLKICSAKTVTFDVTSSWTIAQVKQRYLEEVGDFGKARLYEKHDRRAIAVLGIAIKQYARNIEDNKTLKDIGIVNGLHMPLVTSYNHIFDDYNNDWKVMYSRCPVCVFKYEKDKNKLKKYYWRHPSENKAYTTDSEPSNTYAVEIKENKIRCAHCRNEADAFEWVYKCPNHDYEKINN